MAFPLLDDVAGIVVEDLPCDGLPGIVLKAAAALNQGPLFLAQLEQQLVNKFKNEIGKDFATYGEAVRDQVKDEMDKSFSSGGFDRWLAEFDRANFFSKLFDPFTPLADTQPIHNDNFSLFGTDALSAGNLEAGSVGSGVEPGQDGCDGVLATGLRTGPTTSFVENAGELRNTFAAAGKVMGFAATLVSNPELLLYTLLQTAEDVLSFLAQANVSVTAVKSAASKTYNALKTVKPEDYAKRQDLLTFASLLDQTVSAADAAAKGVAGGVKADDLLKLDSDVITALQRASGWIQAAGGLDAFYTTQSLTLGQILLAETQTSMLEGLVLKSSSRLSNILNGVTNLTQAPRSSAPTAYYASVFTTIRCQAAKIRNELSFVNQQKTQDFFMKRMQWGVTLQSLRLMAEKFSVKQFQQKLMASVVSPVGVELNGFSTDINITDIEALEAAADELSTRVAAFNKMARAKLRSNVSQNLLDAAYRELNLAADAYAVAQAKLSSRLTSLLGGGSVKSAKAAATAFLVATAAVTVLKPLVEAMRSGDFDSMFSRDAITDSLENLLAKLLAKAESCCADSGATDSQSRSGLIRLNEMQTEASDDSRRAGLDSVFFEEVGSASSINAKFAIRQLKADLRELTLLLKIPCLGGLEITPIFL